MPKQLTKKENPNILLSSVGDPDPEIFDRIRIPDPDPTPLKLLIINQKMKFVHSNIISTKAFHQTMKKTSELLVKTT
jgi:hypothetical protein